MNQLNDILLAANILSVYRLWFIQMCERKYNKLLTVFRNDDSLCGIKTYFVLILAIAFPTFRVINWLAAFAYLIDQVDNGWIEGWLSTEMFAII